MDNVELFKELGIEVTEEEAAFLDNWVKRLTFKPTLDDIKRRLYQYKINPKPISYYTGYDKIDEEPVKEDNKPKPKRKVSRSPINWAQVEKIIPKDQGSVLIVKNTPQPIWVPETPDEVRKMMKANA